MKAHETASDDLARRINVILNALAATIPCESASFLSVDSHMEIINGDRVMQAGKDMRVPLPLQSLLHLKPAGGSFANPVPRTEWQFCELASHSLLGLSDCVSQSGCFFGSLLIWRSSENNFTGDELGLVGAYAEQIALTIENLELSGQARRRALHLEVAAQVGRELIQLRDVDRLLEKTVQVVRESFGYYQVHILLIDQVTNELCLHEANGPSSGLMKSRGLRLRTGRDGITGWVAGTGIALLCNDVAGEPRFLKEELLPETESELAVPLRLRGKVLGVLDVQSDKLNNFDEQDEIALQLISDQVAIALENARLFQETKTRLIEMRALHDVSLDIVSQLELAQVLDTLLQRATGLVQAEGGVISVWDENKQVVRNVAQHNTRRNLDGATVRSGEGLLGYVVQTGEPLVVNNYDEWPHALKNYLPNEQPVTMAVPLRWHGQVIGAIAVLNQGGGHKFTLDDQRVLSALADLATIALKNAELYTQVKSFNRTLEEEVVRRTGELEQARRLTLEKAEQLQSLLSKTIHIQDEERARIARDLHDSVTQLAIGAMLELQAAKADLNLKAADAALEKMEMARELLKQIEREIRQAIYDLRPFLLEGGGLPAALQTYAASLQELLKLPCEVRVCGAPARLPPQVEVVIFRIVQESLQNVVAHARASRAQLTLDFQPKMLRVSVADDGNGFDLYSPSQIPRTRFGFTSMRERAAAIGGELKITTEVGKGTTVTLQVPNEALAV